MALYVWSSIMKILRALMISAFPNWPTLELASTAQQSKECLAEQLVD